MPKPARPSDVVKFAPKLRALLLVSFLAGACSGSDADSPPLGASSVVSEHHPIQVGVAQLNVGDDCTKNGRSACKSDVCLKVTTKRKDGYVCSTPCSSGSECLPSWTCRPIAPGPGNGVCVPPLPRSANHRDGGV